MLEFSDGSVLTRNPTRIIMEVTLTKQHSVGDVLSGGYRVIDIKRGGMGVVYICHQPPDRFYAVKTAALLGEQSEKLQKYFRTEVDNWIRISSSHKHPNIVQALLYNEDERWLFLEYINGLPLHEVVKGGPLHPKHALDWAHGIAVGMDHLHREFTLIHRDLKPQNILVAGLDLIPKITDLGIAKVLELDGDGQDNTVIGTLRISVVAKMKTTLSGGSSRVFNRALKAPVDSI